MDQLISVVNELHDAFANVKMNIKLNLPQIAVVGSQSSGKSSVLEAIVGKDFLPRGSGIVTRCPLVLQLVQLPKGTEEEWGEFLHKPNKKFFNFAEINDEIQNRTVEVAGKSAITDRPINLKVFSSHVLNLTLVDLPGLVMNAVGDQPKDIDRQIKEMVTRYVSPANTIILAISPANTDLATSASLRLAKQLDPEGMRTVGVLTKIDLMDRGTDAYDMLTGKLVNLRHGFVGVVNRSQQDINDAKGMAAAREDERAFFHSHPSYSAIADRQGTEYLAQKLNHLLLEHIKAVIPDLKVHVDKLMEGARRQMEKFGMLEQENMDPSATMLSLIKQFSDALNHTIDGGATDATKELLGGARLDYIFNECFAAYVNGLTASKDLTDEYIRINTRNMSGMHATLFPSDQVFVALSKQQISRLEEPSQKCVQFVYEELIKIVDICASKLERFPKLKHAVVEICHKSLQEYRVPTSSHVRTIIGAERGFINVKHPLMEELAQRAFLKIFGTGTDEKGHPQPHAAAEVGKDKVKRGLVESIVSQGEKTNMGAVPTTIMLGNKMSAHEQHINNAIREMVEGYFTIVKSSVADQVPKAITLLMISKLREEVYARLVRNLYSDKAVDDLLAESPEVATQRKATTTMMKALVKAQAALENVREFTLVKD
ncbi:putative dynamin, putative,vacuolar sortin protein 1 [Trypanosoma grayi]|uniref:putative dynamin, putative,vacuolar sortin protein 1 n=1 Tax=Trypanosoma grayi TaxID=71804 RepID=UPI0004F4B1F0|nr:putative dynamin, putative,vacuolar sortin protein 1 [Trypanosoma grayi]KEG14621.1 putative dynamin, putative,vacuolar sortin protein 1 [Trypanosoma grayi]